MFKMLVVRDAIGYFILVGGLEEKLILRFLPSYPARPVFEVLGDSLEILKREAQKEATLRGIAKIYGLE